MLLDEPDAHLDLHHQLNIFRLLTRLNQERSMTIVVVLHD
jgi:iron complex transport system ATP-binding protein